MNIFDILREELEGLKKTFATSEIGADCVGEGLCKSIDCAECVLIHVTEAVNQAEKEYNNGWIPLEEPPKDDKPVLLSFANFTVPLVGRYEEDDEGGAYYLGDEDASLMSQGIFVNAWQPLPEPYRGEGYSKVQSNADRIRSMSDEELAKSILALNVGDYEKIPFCQNSTRCDEILDKGEPVPHELCKQCVIEWLKKAMEE